MTVSERDLDQRVAHLRWPSEDRKRIRSMNLLEHLRRGPPAHQSDRPLPRRDQRAEPDLGRAGTSSRGWRGVVMTPRSVADN
jgi:hypothetical protein